MTGPIESFSLSGLSGGLVRAAVLADVLDFLESRAPGERKRIEALLPAEMVRTLDEASRLAWLPVEVDVELSNRLLERLGPDELRRFSIRASHAALEVPLLAGPARLLRSALETSPAMVFRTIGLGWKLSYRRMGVVAFRSTGGGRGTVVFEGLPVVVLESEGMCIALRGIVEAAAELCADPVEVGESRVSLDDRKLELAVSW